MNPPSLALKPVISYPRQAQVGMTYLMTIDLIPTVEEWPYDDEEYFLYCAIDDRDSLFTIQPADEPFIVLHRYGGTYGAAQFLLTAKKEIRDGSIKVTLITEWAMPIKVFDLTGIEVTKEKVVADIQSVKTVMPVDWATTMNSLDKTIEDIETAFANRVSPDIPPELAAILSEIQKINDIRAMPQRIALCQQALTYVSKTTAPQLWSGLQVELGNSYAQNPLGNRADNLEKAIEGYQAALQVTTREVMPHDHRQTQRNLGHLHFDENNWQAAHTAYKAALQTTETLYTLAPS
jgi:tetratricopeptide (TPR) repeat protein